MILPKKEIYLGEVIEVQLQLFIRDGVANAGGILQSFERLGGSPFKADGFSSLKTACAQRQRAQVGNGIYDAATLVTSLSPVKAGSLMIDAINVTLTLQLPAGDQGGGYFGLFQRYQERRVPISIDAESVTVLPLPPDPPAGFSGAVGSYALAVTAGPTNVSAGDPITVKIQISGSGALESIALPDQPAWNQFKTYPPTSKLETSDPLGVTGARIFEEIVVPQNPDIKALPPVSFSYFDCDKKSYQTLSAPGIALTVRPGGNTTVPASAAGTALRRTIRRPRRTLCRSSNDRATSFQSGRPWCGSHGFWRYKPRRCWPWFPPPAGANAAKCWQTIRGCA